VTRGTGRTAEELGRAFPGVRVIVSDGERIVQQVTGAPALVVATRGAEPIAPGGYAAVLLLDGERMLARENLRVGDDCLRWWSNAAALAAPSAPVVLVGVGGELGQALATWRQDGYASGELADRRQLRFPPAVRIASVTGQPQAVQTTLDAVEPGSAIDVLGPVQVGDGAVRAIVRFEYANGARVAAALRAAVVRNATSAKRAPRGGFRPAPTLRVRFDDPEIL
jgi:primosomal protein N' (replication factor Y)